MKSGARGSGSLRRNILHETLDIFLGRVPGTHQTGAATGTPLLAASPSQAVDASKPRVSDPMPMRGGSRPPAATIR